MSQRPQPTPQPIIILQQNSLTTASPSSYSRVNAYTKPPTIQQIFSLASMVTVIILHSIFILPPIVSVIRDPILYFLLALFYSFLAIIIIDYLYLTIRDPVDSIVSGQVNHLSQSPQDVRYCPKCHSSKFLKSYHCRSCDRCTQSFDHHCRYLNNCIGGKNYQSFFRILTTLTVYLTVIVSQCIWVFVEAFQVERLDDYMISKWPVLIIAILVVCMIFGVDSLLLYHIYLNLERKMTTVEYVFRDTLSNRQQSQDTNNNERNANSPQVFIK